MRLGIKRLCYVVFNSISKRYSHEVKCVINLNDCFVYQFGVYLRCVSILTRRYFWLIRILDSAFDKFPRFLILWRQHYRIAVHTETLIFLDYPSLLKTRYRTVENYVRSSHQYSNATEKSSIVHSPGQHNFNTTVAR